MLLAAVFTPETWYYVWASVLVVVCLCSWGANFVTLPGNWIMVLAAVLFAWLVHDPGGRSLQWTTVGATLLLAIIGEVIEFWAGAAGAKKQGGSRRGMLLAMVGAMVGSIVGAVVGIPIPVVGSLVAAVVGGGLGAFTGAYLGESWKGKDSRDSLAVSTGALVGRILGTLAKLVVGLVILVVITVDAFVNTIP